jgi:hypothetical protein
MAKSRESALESSLGLIGSEDILVFSSGERDGEVLNDLLEEVAEHERDMKVKLKASTKIPIIHDKRVRGFDPEDPEWEKIEETRTLGTLKRWYRELYGEPFRYREYEWNPRTDRKEYLEQ